MKSYVILIAAAVCVTVLSTHVEAQAGGSDCQTWNAKVDPNVPGKTAIDVSMLSDEDVLAAIGCLLKNRGNHVKARISGATKPNVSQMLPPATIELASLYYISYLFTRDYGHGDGVALWNSHGVINPPGSIDHAYEAYRIWFERLKSLGLAAAREQRLDPLSGTNLCWYGK